MSEMVYLDLCCFKRPFDDATVERIRREAEAVAAILDMTQPGCSTSCARLLTISRTIEIRVKIGELLLGCVSKPLPSPLQRAIQPAIGPVHSLIVADVRLGAGDGCNPGVLLP